MIYLRLGDAAFRLEPQQNEDALAQLQAAATALYEFVKTELVTQVAQEMSLAEQEAARGRLRQYFRSSAPPQQIL